MYIQWVMAETIQFSMRIEDELLRKVDEEAEKEYKNRTELIKEAVRSYLEEKEKKTHLKKVAAELWLKGELSQKDLKKALTEEETKDIIFGKKWVEDALHEMRS